MKHLAFLKKDGKALKKDGVLFSRDRERKTGRMGGKTADAGSAPSFLGVRIARKAKRKYLRIHADIRETKRKALVPGLPERGP